MQAKITSVQDIRNWVDNATSDWLDRDDTEIEMIVAYLRSQDDCPAWGTDWSSYLESKDRMNAVS